MTFRSTSSPALMVRRELLTNFQVDRIVEGKRDGYFYGNYKVLYMVGAGTFARVYRALHRDTKRDRAVKVLRKRYADDVVTTEQFLREARMVMPLRHPNIVPVYEVLEEHHRPFMVMDFIEGQNLRDFIKVRKRLDLDVSLRLLGDMLAGLHYALSKGVTHRDMKLSNVLISSHGRAKLVDFGLAAISADMSEEAIAAAPNPRSIDYAGLERITGVRKNDKRSDIYFAGAILYHMLTGRPPLFETRDRIKRLSVARFRELTPLGQLVPGLPNYVIAFCNRAMDLKPERRYQTAGEMLEELNHVMKRLKSGDAGVHAPDRDTAPPEEPDEFPAAGQRLARGTRGRRTHDHVGGIQRQHAGCDPSRAQKTRLPGPRVRQSPARLAAVSGSPGNGTSGRLPDFLGGRTGR